MRTFGFTVACYPEIRRDQQSGPSLGRGGPLVTCARDLKRPTSNRGKLKKKIKNRSHKTRRDLCAWGRKDCAARACHFCASWLCVAVRQFCCVQCGVEWSIHEVLLEY